MAQRCRSCTTDRLDVLVNNAGMVDLHPAERGAARRTLFAGVLERYRPRRSRSTRLALLASWNAARAMIDGSRARSDRRSSARSWAWSEWPPDPSPGGLRRLEGRRSSDLTRELSAAVGRAEANSRSTRSRRAGSQSGDDRRHAAPKTAPKAADVSACRASARRPRSTRPLSGELRPAPFYVSWPATRRPTSTRPRPSRSTPRTGPRYAQPPATAAERRAVRCSELVGDVARSSLEPRRRRAVARRAPVAARRQRAAGADLRARSGIAERLNWLVWKKRSRNTPSQCLISRERVLVAPLLGDQVGPAPGVAVAPGVLGQVRHLARR